MPTLSIGEWMERIRRALGIYTNFFLRRRVPTLVYSMERSGSVPLLHSLQSQGVFVIGAHYLDPKKLAKQPHSGSAGWASRHIVSKQAHAKVISLVRSPIDNMLSTFAREDFGQQTSAQEDVVEQADPDQLSQQFVQDYLQTDRYLQPLRWFELEFQAALGVDVYRHPFDQQRGFVRFCAEPYEVLIMKTELPDDQKAKLVADFVGIPQLKISDPSLASETSASNKRRRLPPGKPGDQTDYADKYQTLKQHVAIPREYLNAIVDSQYVRHFFTVGERETLRTKYGGA